MWDIRMRVECVSSKSIGASLNLTISTRLCYEKLIGLSLITFCFSTNTKFLLFDLELCDMLWVTRL